MHLFRRFALGDIDAFETLVRQFQGDVYAWIVRIVRDPGIAEDLTVETLWRIYRARHQFRFPRTVLISPLCAMNRNGCASGQDGNVFVENLECASASADVNLGSPRSG